MSKVELSQAGLSNEEILEVFKKYQALKEGHFLLTSGRHSNRYLQCALVLQYPAVAEKLCRQLIKKDSDRGYRHCYWTGNSGNYLSL